MGRAILFNGAFALAVCLLVTLGRCVVAGINSYLEQEGKPIQNLSNHMSEINAAPSNTKDLIAGTERLFTNDLFKIVRTWDWRDGSVSS